jgi:hypothetical protein
VTGPSFAHRCLNRDVTADMGDVAIIELITGVVRMSRYESMCSDQTPKVLRIET